MKRNVALLLSVGVVAMPPCLVARAAEPSPAPLTGAAAWKQVVGNTIVGSTPDGPYAESFAADGTLRILDQDGKAGGRWSLRDTTVCTTVDDEDEECRTIEVDGPAGAFADAAGTRYRFSILPGNPKGL